MILKISNIQVNFSNFLLIFILVWLFFFGRIFFFTVASFPSEVFSFKLHINNVYDIFAIFILNYLIYLWPFLFSGIYIIKNNIYNKVIINITLLISFIWAFIFSYVSIFHNLTNFKFDIWVNNGYILSITISLSVTYLYYRILKQFINY